MIKYCHFILLSFILFCSKEDQQPETFDSLAGSWTFADPQVSGEMWLISVNGIDVIDNKGYFSFETFSFAINNDSNIKYDLNKKEVLEFLRLSSNNSFGMAELFLQNGQVNSNYT